VFETLGLRSGELRVGATDILEAPAWPEPDASLSDWLGPLLDGANDLEASAQQLEPVIDEVLSVLAGADGARLARMSGSGATCFAIFETDADAQRAAQTVQLDHPLWWVHAGTLS